MTAVYHRLKEIRTSLMDGGKPISQAKLAEIIGGDDKGWHAQKIERLENGKTRLNDVDAALIAKRLRMPIWALFVNPDTIINDLDREISSRYKAAPSDVQTTIKRLLGMIELSQK